MSLTVQPSTREHILTYSLKPRSGLKGFLAQGISVLPTRLVMKQERSARKGGSALWLHNPYKPTKPTSQTLDPRHAETLKPSQEA